MDEMRTQTGRLPRNPADDQPEGPTSGQRLAGGLLLANAALVVLEFALMPSGMLQAQAAMLGRQLVPAFIDVLIGISLLAGSKRFIPLALVRVVLGLIIMTLSQGLGNPALAVLQAILSGAFLMLLIGDASKPRMAVGSALFGMYALIAMINVTAPITGKNPLAVWFQSMGGDIGREPAGVVTGASSKYRLHAPSDQWYLRKAVAARKDNPLSDQWITRPDRDAHIIVINEHAPNAVVDVDLYADAVENSIKTNMRGTIVSREPVKENPAIGRILHAKVTVSGLPLEYYFGLFARGDRAFQVIAFAHQDNFPELADELMRAITTFELPAVVAEKG
jgi:hypothetical protein